MKKISVVTPLFNEEHNVRELCERISKTMNSLPYEYEHICIDNCSSDLTVAILKEIAKQNDRLKIIVNARNFGYIRSSYHGMLQAAGDAVILIASDLQDPPEIISDFVNKWEAGYKSIMAVKPSSKENPIFFAFRKLYYKLVSSISETELVANATGSGLYDKCVIEILRKIQDPYPYFRGLVCEIGFPVATVSFVQPKRLRGMTKNNFYTLYDFAMLGITKHSKVPLRLMAISGFLLSIFSLIIAFGYLVAKLLFWENFELGLAPLIIGLFFFFSMQMLFMGILGEYLGAVYTQVRNIPHVIEIERVNFDK